MQEDRLPVIFGWMLESLERNELTLCFVLIFLSIFGAIASMCLSPKNAVSLGASGAVFGLFAVSVLVKVNELLFDFLYSV